jgi:hypothetical protein
MPEPQFQGQFDFRLLPSAPVPSHVLHPTVNQYADTARQFVGGAPPFTSGPQSNNWITEANMDRSVQGG